MAGMFTNDSSFDDELLGVSQTCSPITQAELIDAVSFSALLDKTPIKLKANIEEDRTGDARVKYSEIKGDGPGVLRTEVISMDRLLWADGVMQEPDMGGSNGKTTTAKATFVAFKIVLESDTKSSGRGKDKAVQSADIQVEFHGTGPDADTVGAQRPVVVGWAPFATAERPNETTAQHTRDRSWNVAGQGGVPQAGITLQGGGSDSRAWDERYFDKYRSCPVFVSGPDEESSDYNGVVWRLEQNSLAREGVVPELLVYLLMTRQDDSEYAVKITANVRTTHSFRRKEYDCVMRVMPKEPNRTKPTVCYLEGKKMWELLDVDHFEKLQSPAMNKHLVLPWDVKETAATTDAKSGNSGTMGTSTKAGAKHGTDPENGNINDIKSGDAAKAAPSVTLREAVPPTTQRSGRDAAAPLAVRDVTDAIFGLDRSGNMLDTLDTSDMEGDLPTRIAMLESRIETMEYRMARQAALIRALLKRVSADSK